MSYQEIVAGIGVFLLGLSPKLYDWLFGGRRASFIKDAQAVVDLMRSQSDELKVEVACFKLEVARLQALVGTLESELVALGVDRDRIEAIKRAVQSV